MVVTKEEIEQYLFEVKAAVSNDRYRLDRNSKRLDNNNLFLDYVIDESKAKEIILSLDVTDFSEILQNEHAGFETVMWLLFHSMNKNIHSSIISS